MEQEFFRQFCNPQRRVGIPELIETKERENEKVMDFIARWRGLTFECPLKFTQQELVPMCLNNLMQDLSTILIPQSFEGFIDLWTKAHDIEIHLNKLKKSANESEGKPGRLFSIAIALRERAHTMLAGRRIKRRI